MLTFILTLGALQLQPVFAEDALIAPVGSSTELLENQTPGYGSNGKFLSPIAPPNLNPTKRIYNAQDLWDVSNDLAGSYVLMNDIDLAGINGGEWAPIGTQNSSFTGVFDGQGYVIKNMTITNSIVEDDYIYAGLFGHVSSAAIKSLGLEESKINIRQSVGQSLVGGIIGYADSAFISNCYNTGDVAITSIFLSMQEG